MDLSILFAQMNNIQEVLLELKNKNAQPAEVARIAPVVDKEKIATRVNAIGANVTQKEHADFDNLVIQYGKRFNRSINANRLCRTVIRHFMNNWENMPMTEEWRAEEELRAYRLKNKKQPQK